MADWPDAIELKRVLNIDSDDWNDTVDRVLAAAISQVKSDVGSWVEATDEPDEKMAQAALRMAELVSERPSSVTTGGRLQSAIASLAQDPTYKSLLIGRRRRFGIG